jgi:hypothetical protein
MAASASLVRATKRLTPLGVFKAVDRQRRRPIVPATQLVGAV